MFAYIDGPYPYYTVVFFAFLFGVGAGLLYECFRILRCAGGILFPIKGRGSEVLRIAAVCLQDLTYFLLLTVAAVLFLFAFNRGQLRLSLLLSMFLGFVLYLATIGKLILRLHRAILRVIYRVLRFVYFHTLYYLFVFLCYLYRKTLARLFTYFTGLCESIIQKIRRKHRKSLLENLILQARGGFEGESDHISIH